MPHSDFVKHMSQQVSPLLLARKEGARVIKLEDILGKLKTIQRHSLKSKAKQREHVGIHVKNDIQP